MDWHHKGTESAFEWFECESSVFLWAELSEEKKEEEEEWMDDDFIFSFSAFERLLK